MKEAIGTSMVFNLIMIFTSVFIALFVGSIAYSKSFKIRNRIIDIIEENRGYDDDAMAQIEENLASIGYQIGGDRCPEKNNEQAMDPVSDYNFCVYKFQADRGAYYGVIAFIHLDIPIIGNRISIPIYGETKTIYDTSITY